MGTRPLAPSYELAWGLSLVLWQTLLHGVRARWWPSGLSVHILGSSLPTELRAPVQWKRVGGLTGVSKVVACCWGLGPHPLPPPGRPCLQYPLPQEVGVKWGKRGPAPQL